MPKRDVTLLFFNSVCGDYVILSTSYFLRCKSNCSAKNSSNKNSDCPIGQALELFYLPTDIFRLPRAIEQALVSNTGNTCQIVSGLSDCFRTLNFSFITQV